MSEKTITEEEVIMSTLYKYHLNIGTPIGLIQEFLITLINEDKENIIEKKYIFLKKHYLDLYQEHIQDYRYE